MGRKVGQHPIVKTGRACRERVEPRKVRWGTKKRVGGKKVSTASKGTPYKKKKKKGRGEKLLRDGGDWGGGPERRRGPRPEKTLFVGRQEAGSAKKKGSFSNTRDRTEKMKRDFRGLVHRKGGTVVGFNLKGVASKEKRWGKKKIARGRRGGGEDEINKKEKEEGKKKKATNA